MDFSKIQNSLPVYLFYEYKLIIYFDTIKKNVYNTERLYYMEET